MTREIPQRLDVLEKLRVRVARNAFNTWLGMELTFAADGVAETRTCWRDEFASTPERGATHGGILASLIDACCCYAAASRTGAMVTTVDLRVDYHAVAERGMLRTRAEIIRSGRTMASVDAQVFDGDGLLVASGRGTFMHLPEIPI